MSNTTAILVGTGAVAVIGVGAAIAYKRGVFSGAGALGPDGPLFGAKTEIVDAGGVSQGGGIRWKPARAEGLKGPVQRAVSDLVEELKGAGTIAGDIAASSADNENAVVEVALNLRTAQHYMAGWHANGAGVAKTLTVLPFHVFDPDDLDLLASDINNFRRVKASWEYGPGMAYAGGVTYDVRGFDLGGAWTFLQDMPVQTWNLAFAQQVARPCEWRGVEVDCFVGSPGINAVAFYHPGESRWLTAREGRAVVFSINAQLKRDIDQNYSKFAGISIGAWGRWLSRVRNLPRVQPWSPDDVHYLMDVNGNYTVA